MMSKAGSVLEPWKYIAAAVFTLLGAILIAGMVTSDDMAGSVGMSDASVGVSGAETPPEPASPPNLEPSGQDEVEPDKSPLELSDPDLLRVVNEMRRKGLAPADVAVEGQSLYVDVYHSMTEQAAEEAVEGVGGRTFGSIPGITVALVDIERLAELEAIEGIDFVRLPDPPPSPVTGETEDPDSLEPLSVSGLLAATNADSWHAANIKGQGIKVGVFDYFDQAHWSAAQQAGRLPAPSGGMVCGAGSCSPGIPWTTTTGDHGVSSAEIIYAMASNVQFYLGPPTSNLVREREVIDSFASQGVRIISRSLGSNLYSPNAAGDGTGPAADNVAYAAGKGILWVNSAGNNSGATDRRGSHLRLIWDGNSSESHLLTPEGSTFHPVACSGNVWLSIRWSNDWHKTAASRSDFDLYVYGDASTANFLGKSVEFQQSGARPVEAVNIDCGTPARWIYLRVHLYNAGSGTGGDAIQILAGRGATLHYWSNPHSSSIEHEASGNASFISAGALEPLGGSSIAMYSSWGPTVDGRVKPDLSAGACVRTLASERAGSQCQNGIIGANGTSAAAPVISGASALVMSSGEATSPPQVRNYLISHAVDLGVAGADNIFGAGDLKLPDPPAQAVDTQVPTWAGGQLRADAGEREVVLSWSAAQDNVGVAGYIVYAGSGEPIDGVYYGSEVGRLGHTARTHNVSGLEPGTRYVFKVEAFDEARNMSTDGPLRVRSTANQFIDTSDSVFEDDIRWLSSTEVTRGCNPPANDRFCPDDHVTRGQMATFLVRALGLQGADGFDYFVDDENSVHEQSINTLALWEITKGCNPPRNDRFCPDDPVLRGQMASFLSRALLLVDGWNVDYFSDDNSSVAEFDINRLAHSGITRGCNPPGNTLFCPFGPVTRGQMAAFLHRSADKIDEVRALIDLGPLSADSDLGTRAR